MKKLSILLTLILLLSGCLNPALKSYVEVAPTQPQGQVKFMRMETPPSQTLHYNPKIKLKKGKQYKTIGFLGHSNTIYGWSTIKLPVGINRFKITLGNFDRDIEVDVEENKITPVGILVRQGAVKKTYGNRVNRSFKLETIIYEPVSIEYDQINFKYSNYKENLKVAKKQQCDICYQPIKKQKYYRDRNDKVCYECLPKRSKDKNSKLYNYVDPIKTAKDVQAALTGGRFTEAKPLIEKLILQDKKNPHLFYMLALCYYNQREGENLKRDTKRAVKAIDKAIKLAPNVKEYKKLKQVLLLDVDKILQTTKDFIAEEKYTEAYIEINKIFEASISHPEALYLKALSCAKLNLKNLANLYFALLKKNYSDSTDFINKGDELLGTENRFSFDKMEKTDNEKGTVTAFNKWGIIIYLLSKPEDEFVKQNEDFYKSLFDEANTIKKEKLPKK